MSPYTIVLREIDCVLVKRQLESRQRQLEKTAVVKAGAYIVSRDRKTIVTDWKFVKLPFLKTKLSIATCLHISLTCP